MNRKLRKLITTMMLAGALAAAGPFARIAAWAENTRIAFSDPSVMVGNEVTVTMKVTSDSPLGTAEIMLSYDPNVLEFVNGTNANGGAGAIKVLGTMESADQKTFSFNLKFKALQAGNTQISVTSQEIYDMDSQTLSLDKQGSSTVKVTSPVTYSNDAALKSLKISPGTLTPEFSPSVDQYQASVDGNTADLVVNAVASNAGASVSLEGEKGLKAGENQVTVRVTAEDGQTVKNYTILVTKAEGGQTAPAAEGGETLPAQFGDMTVDLDGTQYHVAASFDEAALPEGFEMQTYVFKGTEVMAGKGLEKDLLLLYLQDEGGNGGFYIYNEEGDSWSRFVQVETTSKAVVILPLDADVTVPEGFDQRQIDIDGIRVTGWIENSEAEPQYCIFYAMNWNGEKGFYRYDLSEKTIQRYFASGVSSQTYTDMALTYNELARDYHIQFYALIAVSTLALVLLVLAIILIRKGRFQAPEEKRRSREEFFDEPIQEEPPAKVRRYSREEFSEETLKREQEEKDKEDFFEEASLEEMEQKLKKQKAPKQELPQDKTGQEQEENDFEFIDLDDK